jgi:hypothetical protein
MPLTTGKLNHHSQGAHQKPHQTPPDHTMEEFLHLSHIHPDDTRTRALLLRLKITHWVYFKYSTEDSLRRLGFIEGPARFLSLQLTGWEYNEHSRGVQSSNHTMEEFLHLAHIVPEDGETRTLISDLFITHWSYFKYSTEDSLRDLGFVEGPARYLFLAGHKHS